MLSHIIVGTAVFGICFYWFNKKYQSVRNQKVELLKNALMTFALNILRSKDFDSISMKYSEFDGTKLPKMSGCDLNNALFSYIMSKEKLRNGPFYSKIMEDKITAIEKYLEYHFDTYEKVENFLSEFIDYCTAITKNAEAKKNNPVNVEEENITTKQTAITKGAEEENNTTKDTDNKTTEESNNNTSVDDFIVVKEHSI